MLGNACNKALCATLVRPGTWQLRLIAFGMAIVLQAALPNLAQAQGTVDVAQAQVLYEEAQRLMAQKKYEEACPKLAESQKLDPGIGTLLKLAKCYEQVGKTASAWASLVEAESMAHKAKDDRRELRAKALAAQLVPKLTRLNVVVPAPVASIRGVEVRLEGALIGAARWGQALPVDPGTYRIEASAPGKTTWSKSVAIAGVGKTIPVEIPMLEDAPAPPAKPSPKESASGQAAPEGRTAQDKPTPNTPSNGDLSHARQLGLFYRIDVDPIHVGQVSSFGLSYGIANHFEIAAAGLVGKDKGVWAGMTGYFSRGKWKPRLTLGTHVFFADGVQVGLHGAGGLQWDPTRHVGLFLDAGVSYWPVRRVAYGPTKTLEYDTWLFIPAAGIQGRL